MYQKWKSDGWEDATPPLSSWWHFTLHPSKSYLNVPIPIIKYHNFLLNKMRCTHKSPTIPSNVPPKSSNTTSKNIFAVASFTALKALDWCGVFALALVRVGRHLEVKAISKVRIWWFHRDGEGCGDGGFLKWWVFPPNHRFSIIFTIHFWVPLFLETPRCTSLMEMFLFFQC